jgi:hypothetical protein
MARRDGKRVSSERCCHVGRKIGEQLASNQICVQLTGNRGYHVAVTDDEQISNLRKRIAHEMGVKEGNWGIYMHHNNKLKIVEDTKQINQIDRKGLHFYPKAVIR